MQDTKAGYHQSGATQSNAYGGGYQQRAAQLRLAEPNVDFEKVVVSRLSCVIRAQRRKLL